MKKVSNRVIMTCLIGELIVLSSLLVLSGKNNYLWIAVGIAAVLTLFTFYTSVCRIGEIIKTWSEENKNRDQERENANKEFRVQLVEMLDKNKEALSERVAGLLDIQEKMKSELTEKLSLMNANISSNNKNIEESIVEFTHKVECAVSSREEKNAKLLGDLTVLFEKQNGVFFEKNAEEINGICTKFTEIIKSFSDDIGVYLNNLDDANREIKINIETATALQAEALGNNQVVLQNITNIVGNIETQNKQVIDDLSEQFIKHSVSMSEQHSKDLSSIVSEMKAGIEILTEKYRQALEEMSQRQIAQIDEWKSGTTEILDRSNSTIEVLLNNVESKLIENSDLANRVLDENITTTKKAVSEFVNETRDLLQGQYDNLNELSRELNISTKDYSQQLMEQILTVSNGNVSEMKQSCESTLEKIVDRIVAENEQTGCKRTEAFESHIKELENTYDAIISAHIKALEEQIIKSIELFMSENKEALATNNELATNLISSERSFVSEIENNNSKLRETINTAFAEYSKSVEQNIIEMKDVLSESISNSSQIAMDGIDKMTEKNSETIGQLAEKLCVYSDSFVEKSAIAIAGVQADNNAKLQELCDQVAGYISENAKFAAHCKDLNDSLHSKIVQMIEDRKRFVEELKDISDKQLIGMDDQLKERIKDMVEKLQNLNVENVEAFSGTMVEYRDTFVKANAKAIAEVQVDNVDSITDANQKVAQLAENMKKFQEDIVGTLTVLQTIIEDGIKEQREQDENFDSSINNLVDEKLSEYNIKLQEYNESFAALGNKITDVMTACQSNTAKYDETLNFIIDAQKVANSLSSKDIELLKTFMKR